MAKESSVSPDLLHTWALQLLCALCHSFSPLQGQIKSDIGTFLAHQLLISGLSAAKSVPAILIKRLLFSLLPFLLSILYLISKLKRDWHQSALEELLHDVNWGPAARQIFVTKLRCQNGKLNKIIIC